MFAYDYDKLIKLCIRYVQTLPCVTFYFSQALCLSLPIQLLASNVM